MVCMIKKKVNNAHVRGGEVCIASRGCSISSMSCTGDVSDCFFYMHISWNYGNRYDFKLRKHYDLLPCCSSFIRAERIK